MTETKRFPIALAEKCDELKKLIAENPDLPIVVLAGDYVLKGYYSWSYCDCVSCCITEILDCEVPYECDFVECDRDSFNEKIEVWLWEKITQDNNEPNEDDFLKMLAEEKAKYEPYWRKVIAIYAWY